MIWTAAFALCALLASVLLTLAGQVSPVAAMHLVFAVGIVPLIFAAISHFVPVLTRSGEPALWIRWIPAVAQVLGLLIFAVLMAWVSRSWLVVAAVAEMLLAAALLVWVWLRRRRCIGAAHPCSLWYLMALACLLLALLAIVGQGLRPQHYQVLRVAHLHLNTLGLLGFAALGTLPVLLPTALGRPDPQAAQWLRRWWWRLLLALGSLLAALLFVPASVPHLLLVSAAGLFYLGASTSLLRQWSGCFSWQALWRDGVAASLSAALLGFCTLLLAGFLHGLAWIEPRAAIAAWVLGFLLPLVSGALTQLLPVWLYPGPLTPRRTRLRERLARHGQWRAVLFLTGCFAALLGLSQLGVVLALAALLGFLAPLLLELLRYRANQQA